MRPKQNWQFWIDRGGTFTDIVAVSPSGEVTTHKLLSENPTGYADAAIEGIRRVMGVAPESGLATESIGSVKMGTTVATNALLERRGERTLLLITKGFGDALRIGHQARPRIFDLDISLPDVLYERVVEVDERLAADGTVVRDLDEVTSLADLEAAYRDGFRSVAIVLVHGYRHSAHETHLADLAAKVGFTQISVSHQVSPLMKLVARGDTTTVDAYLSPVLRRYVDQVASSVSGNGVGSSLLFMQSNGGLAEASSFRGCDALLSGPAGGVVGMVRTAEAAGFDRLIGFDMGGTSTDVSHYAGEFERSSEAEVAGVRVRAPMMDIHTVAAGGGSLLSFDGERMTVGPESAGADPGPTSYGRGGPLAVTDANVLLGRLRPEFFPRVFGSDGHQGLDVGAVSLAFSNLADLITTATGRANDPNRVAQGFLDIAIDNMANAVKKISVQRGYDLARYTLVSFGGAGGQHACAVADRLGIRRVHVHPHAGVLSAVGIGLADQRQIVSAPVETRLDAELLEVLDWGDLERRSTDRLVGLGEAKDSIRFVRSLSIRYVGSDTSLTVPSAPLGQVETEFARLHRSRFGFTSPDKALVVGSIQVEAIAPTSTRLPSSSLAAPDGPTVTYHPVVFDGSEVSTPFVIRSTMTAGYKIVGPAVVVETTGTTQIDPGWAATVNKTLDLVIERVGAAKSRTSGETEVDPIRLEIFNNLFMNVAEQMGLVLENTAASVNIKERLDFSCAIFDPNGELIANAPHMPVHLGSMDQSIRSIIRANPRMNPGDVYVMNAPYNGGTHLPDVTVVKPVFGVGSTGPIFYVASRGHHSDIGGTVPGSAPANSTSIEEEGVLIDNFLLVDRGEFAESAIMELLTTAKYPARNPDQNVADLRAQVAACEKGSTELARVIDEQGLDVVHAYMGHVMDNAEESVRRVIDQLDDASFSYSMDDGYRVEVAIEVDHEDRSVVVDFTGSSPTHPGNFNAPSAIASAAVLYVFRCLVDADIPLNAGCGRPITIVLPKDSMINPVYPAAVIAGNVETSQVIVDTLFGALKVAGASQGTMNNFIWGNNEFQYYETICGGAGATATADGCDAVQTHMTNSRLTDPEVLEWRFPVRLEEFSIRRGSGGNGEHKGGDGVVRRIRFGEAMEVNVLSGRRRVPPYGMAGGLPGAVGHNRKISANGEVTEFGAVFATTVAPGDQIEIETPGGGGYGRP